MLGIKPKFFLGDLIFKGLEEELSKNNFVSV
jgi:hypothetical protein